MGQRESTLGSLPYIKKLTQSNASIPSALSIVMYMASSMISKEAGPVNQGF